MVLMAALSIFSYVYMQVLMSFLISIAVTDSKLINYLYPIMYTVQMFGTLIKIYIVDPNSESFQSLTFTMLIIQGLGFVFIPMGADMSRWTPTKVGALRESDSNRFYQRHGFRLVEQGEFDNYYLRPNG